MRVHLVLGIVAFLTGRYFALSRIELIILLFTILFVLIAEMINTVVEKALDFINGKKLHPQVKIIKDIAAGAVLLSSINALIVGWVLFYPHLAKVINTPWDSFKIGIFWILVFFALLVGVLRKYRPLILEILLSASLFILSAILLLGD